MDRYFLIIFLLSACAHPSLETQRSESNVVMEWQKTRHAVEQRCKEEGAGAQLTIRACAVTVEDRCKIIAVKPEDWSDHSSMGIIGHELMHCLGAKHPEPK